MALTTLITNTVAPFTKPQSVSHLTNGITTDVNSVQFPLQVGVPVQNIYTFKVIPASVNATCIAAAASYFGSGAAGGAIRLNTTTQGTGADITATYTSVLGRNGLLLDCERYIALSFSTATLATTVVTVTGLDYRGVSIVASTSVPLGTTGTLPIGVPVSFVSGISFSVNPFVGNGSAVLSVGNTGYIGLPYYLRNTQYVISSSWNNAPIPDDAGAILQGYNWRGLTTFAGINSCARGFVNVGGDQPDGESQLVVTYYVLGSDSELNAEIKNLNQSSLKIAGIQKTASSAYPNPVYVLPYLIDYDLTGVQINPGLPAVDGNSGDSAFLIKYADACAA
jgi:hypothetical protein